MTNVKTTLLALLSLGLFVQSASAETLVEMDKKYQCVVDETASENSELVRSKDGKRFDIKSLIQKLRKKAKKPSTPQAKRKRLRAKIRRIKQCQQQKGNFEPGELDPPKTGPVYAKATLLTTGTGIAVKCNLVISENSDTGLATGGAIFCNINGVIAAGSATFFLWGDGEVWSQALMNTLFISPNGQFNNITVDLDAETAENARTFIRETGSVAFLRGNLLLNGATGQTFDFNGNFEETSGEGDCRLQASVQGQGNSGQVFLDLADGTIEVQLGDETQFLTFINIFAGPTPNSPTVGQFGIPQSIIDTLPQSEFSFQLEAAELAQVQNAVNNISQELTVGIPQGSPDATLVGRFTEPQIDCQVLN